MTPIVTSQQRLTVINLEVIIAEFCVDLIRGHLDAASPGLDHPATRIVAVNMMQCGAVIMRLVFSKILTVVNTASDLCNAWVTADLYTISCYTGPRNKGIDYIIINTLSPELNGR